MTYVLNFSVFQHVFCGDFAAAIVLIDEFNILKDQIGSGFWGGWGLALSGCVSTLTGRAAEAVQDIPSGVIAMRSTGNTMWTPLFLTHLAQANAELGQFKSAWTNIHEAMIAVETTKETWYEAEINRVAGEIALLGTEADAVKAEAYFASALDDCSHAASEILGAPRGDEHGATAARSREAGARATSWLRPMAVSPKASTRSTCGRQSSCSRTGQDERDLKLTYRGAESEDILNAALTRDGLKYMPVAPQRTLIIRGAYRSRRASAVSPSE